MSDEQQPPLLPPKLTWILFGAASGFVVLREILKAYFFTSGATGSVVRQYYQEELSGSGAFGSLNALALIAVAAGVCVWCVRIWPSEEVLWKKVVWCVLAFAVTVLAVGVVAEG